MGRDIFDMTEPLTYKEAMQLRKDLHVEAGLVKEQMRRLQLRYDEMLRQDMKLNDLACTFSDKERKSKAAHILLTYGRHGKIHVGVGEKVLHYGDIIVSGEERLFIDKNLKAHLCPSVDEDTYLPEAAQDFLAHYDLSSTNDVLAFYGYTSYNDDCYFYGIMKGQHCVNFSVPL